MTFAYFLDDLKDNIDRLSTDVVVIGEISPDQRLNWTESGRILGMSCALNDQLHPGRNLWPLISDLLPSTIDDTNRIQVAQNILNAVLQYPGEFPIVSEGQQTTAGGYTLWMQDFEYAPGQAVNTDEVYAGVIATIWAGKQILGDSVSIVPVPSSSLFKNLGQPDIDGMLADDGLLGSLKLANLPMNNPQPGSNGQWNVFSVLHHNDLIDGFLGQQYSSNNPDALPGSISQDTRAFDSQDSLPYAILSSFEQLTSSTVGGPPWDSNYDGALPFQAGVYFPASVPASFDAEALLIPQRDALFSTAVAAVQQEENLPILDFRGMDSADKIIVEVTMTREADLSSKVGFYIIQDPSGAVVEPGSGTLIRPGDTRYLEAALHPDNLVANLQSLQARDNAEAFRLESIEGGDLIAPVVEVFNGNQDLTYFAFGSANTDGFNHFREIGPNQFGMEDLPGGGDQDFNDLVISLTFYMG